MDTCRHRVVDYDAMNTEFTNACETVIPPPRFARKAADAAFAARVAQIRAKYGSFTIYLHRRPSRANDAFSQQRPRFARMSASPLVPRS